VARRRSSSSSALARWQREVARQQAASERAHRQAVRTAEQEQRAQARATAFDEKERKRLSLKSRLADAAYLNEDLEDDLAALDGLLAAALTRSVLDFAAMKQEPVLPVWGDAALEIPAPAADPGAFQPPLPTGVSKLFGKGKYEAQFEAGRVAYEAAVAQWRAREAAREQEVLRRRHAFNLAVEAAQATADRQHAEVDRLQAAVEAGQPDAVVTYSELVLGSSPYPDAFPQTFRVAYVPDSRQLVIEYSLPPVAAVPVVKNYKYVRVSDSISQAARPISQVRVQYASVVAQCALRTVHEVFQADRGRNVDVIIFNGVLDTIDPGSGKAVRPCLVTLRTTRDSFNTLDLARVDPLACLKHLSAGVSRSPAELVPVRPVLEFDMVDPRFVAESDALSLLDQRPNLMQLNPNEFEALIQNLFSKMGLDTKLTRASRDGGVDCVAFDPRPIFGGKVVIQAKRYKHTVGVSAVRDLYGTLQNEGASKGILVTTSGYGQASVDFAANKPIELIGGQNLLYLLNEYAGIEAKIEPPDDWTDPAVDPYSNEPRIKL